MRRKVRRQLAARTLILHACFLVASPAAASEQSDSQDEVERWVPSIGFFSGIVVRDSTGSVSTFIDGLGPLRPSAAGDATLVTTMVGGEIELMTPGLTSLPGRPRLFVRGGGSASFGSDKDLAKEGNPGPLVETGGGGSVSLFQGQGSSTNAEVQSPFVSAGAGAAFSFDLWGRRLRLKTSVEYFREELEVTGISNRVVVGPGNPVPLVFEFEGHEKKAFHGVGPGLELEVDAMRMGSLMTSVFVSARAYRFLGNRDVDFADGFATWKYEHDPWAYRSHVGFRLRWLPE